MKDRTELDPIDPIALTRQLCEIESTTYHEGAVGDFLAGFLAGRGWEVEKTPVAQPAESGSAGPRWNVYAGPKGQTPELVFSTHMDTVPPYIPFTEDAEFMYRARSFRRQGNHCGAGCGGGGVARGRVSGWAVVCKRRRARFGRRESREPGAEGKPVPDQRRADGQSSGAGVKGRVAGGVSRERQRWRTPRIPSWARARCTSWCR